jgi:hemolysin III
MEAPPAARGRRPFRIKEPFPGLSHWFGVLLSLGGTILLLSKSDGRPWHVVSFTIYGVSLIMLYLASALNHTIICSPRAAARLEAFDYAAIFCVIAGTYTPLCLVNLRGPWGWALLAAAWTIALLGIASLFLVEIGRSGVRVVAYVAMGWLPLAAAREIIRVLPGAAVAWLIAGGVVYSVGAVVFISDRPNLWRDRFTAHDLWHCMVLIGSACHFIVMLNYVVPAG